VEDSSKMLALGFRGGFFLLPVLLQYGKKEPHPGEGGGCSVVNMQECCRTCNELCNQLRQLRHELCMMCMHGMYVVYILCVM